VPNGVLPAVSCLVISSFPAAVTPTSGTTHPFNLLPLIPDNETLGAIRKSGGFYFLIDY
jgi:hypothetical protein